jgi:signal transduction histidine kinase
MDIDAQVYTSAPFVKVFPIILMVIIATVLTMTTYWGRRKEQSLIELQQQFVSLASHELRSPLTAIRWQAEAALAETQYPKEVHDIFTHIHNSCLSVLDTVNDLLTFASVQQSLVRQGQFEKVDCSGLIDQVCEAVSVSAASKKITITKTTTPNMFVHVDAPRLVTVFTNIVTNAIKYSPEETSVTVSVTHNSTKNTVVVTIMDSGIGIPSDEQAQVLSGFYRATNARTKVHAGTGIGLYISKKIIEAHKGSLEIISPNVGSDRGTTVVVSLPLAR